MSAALPDRPLRVRAGRPTPFDRSDKCSVSVGLSRPPPPSRLDSPTLTPGVAAIDQMERAVLTVVRQREARRRDLPARPSTTPILLSSARDGRRTRRLPAAIGPGVGPSQRTRKCQICPCTRLSGMSPVIPWPGGSQPPVATVDRADWPKARRRARRFESGSGRRRLGAAAPAG